MKTIKITSTRFTRDDSKESSISFKLSDKTAEQVIDEIVDQFTSAFKVDAQKDTNFSFIVTNEDGEIEYQAVNL